jgi:CRP-like cAMP-binding protein
MNHEQMLRSISFFAELSGPEIERILALGEPLAVTKGGRVFAEGEVANDLYLIEDGQIEIFREDRHFGRQTFALLGPGEHFGALSLFYGEPHFSSAQAAKPSRLLAIRQRAFQELLFGQPELARAITHGMVASLRAANQQIRRMTSRFNRKIRPIYKLPRPGPADRGPERTLRTTT